jgi:VWFA-related protein
MARILRLFTILLLPAGVYAGTIVYLRVHRDALEQRLKSPPQDAPQRLQLLRKQFKAAGCANDELHEQPVPKQDLPNLICKLPGKEQGTIIVGAPLDPTDEEAKFGTDWAALALLPLLAESVATVPHRLTFTFVVFSAQQHGLHGSNEYLKQLSNPQQHEIRAMVGLSDIGRTPMVYAVPQDDAVLANWLALSANTMRAGFFPLEITARSVDAPLLNNVHVFNQDDYLLSTKSFQRARVPAIALRSAPLSMIPEMRRTGAWSAKSSGESLDANIYEQAYNQLCIYLLYLDSNLGTPHSAPPSPNGPSTLTAQAPANNSPASAGTSSAQGSVPSTPATTMASNGSTPVPAPTENRTNAALPTDVPVFHAESKLVILDVSVTDDRGAPVKQLKADDFTVLENGKPQTVRVFEVHGSQEAGVAPSAASALPPGTFSNRAVVSGDSPLSIVLFDLLNTPTDDQAYARAQMLEYLRGMPPGKHLAILVLGTKLQMVQGFSDDRETLIRTTEKLMRQVSPLLTSQSQQQQDEGFKDEIGRYAQPSPPNLPASGTNALAAARADSQAAIGFVKQRNATNATMEGTRTDQRTTLTLDALSAIARAFSNYPGRKNVLWLSGSFKIRLQPSSNSYLNISARTTQAASPVSDLTDTNSYQSAIRELTKIMAAGRIALYPIDVRGLRTAGVSIGVGTDQSRSMVDLANNDAYTQTLNNQSEGRFGEAGSMRELAEQTGGQVFLDNDVKGAIARSLEGGSNYYTLAYTPEKSDDKGYRRVEIKLNRRSVKLAYRPGYYPEDSQERLVQSGAHLLAAAMQPGLPQSTMLLMNAKIVPPAPGNKSLRIDYGIDLGGVAFQDAPDQKKRAILDCMTVALDKDGTVVGQVANTVDASLGPQDLQVFQRTGLPFRQEMVLPPGTYDLRLGVIDRASQKIGTLNVPIVIPEEKVN